MKVNKADLLPALRSLCKLALGRQSLYILNSIRCEAANNTLRLRASNIEEDQSEEVPCEGEMQGICIPARIFLELVSAAPDTITMEVDGNSVKITGAGEAKIAYFEAGMFPKEPEDKFSGIGLNPLDLADGIEAVAWAQDVSKNPDKHILKSVHVKTSAHEIMCEAFAGIMFGRFTRASIAADSDFAVHTPFVPRVIECLRKEGAVLSIGERFLRIDSKGATYSCKLMEGKYPTHMDQGVKMVRKKLGELNREAALTPLQICRSLVPPDQTGRINVQFQDKWMQIVMNGQCAHHFTDTIVGKFNRADMCLGLETLVDCMRAFKEDAVMVETHDGDFGPIILSGKELTTFSSQMLPTK